MPFLWFVSLGKQRNEQNKHILHQYSGNSSYIKYDIYIIETKRLKEADRRNIDRFPEDFMFKLTSKEWQSMSSQFVMTYPSKRPKVATPLAFTEHGVAMLANVLKSKKARQTSVSIVRAFIALKRFISDYDELSSKLKDLENKYNKHFKDVYEALNYLLEKDKLTDDQKGRKLIGF